MRGADFAELDKLGECAGVGTLEAGFGAIELQIRAAAARGCGELIRTFSIVPMPASMFRFGCWLLYGRIHSIIFLIFLRLFLTSSSCPSMLPRRHEVRLG